MKSIVEEKLVSFKTLEQKVFKPKISFWEHKLGRFFYGKEMKITI